MSVFVPTGFSLLRDRSDKAQDLALRGRLVGGEMEAFWIGTDGKLQPISREQWVSDDGEAMLECGWWGIGFFPRMDPWPRTARTPGQPPIIIREALAPKIENGSGSKGGRPVGIDWEAILIEMARLTHYGYSPSTQADMVRRIQEWYSRRPQSYGKELGDTDVKKRVRRFFKAIESETEDWES